MSARPGKSEVLWREREQGPEGQLLAMLPSIAMPNVLRSRQHCHSAPERPCSRSRPGQREILALDDRPARAPDRPGTYLGNS